MTEAEGEQLCWTPGICTARLTPVRWVRTVDGRRVMVDPVAAAAGTLQPAEGGRWVVLTGDVLPAQSAAWVRHDGSCAKARKVTAHAGYCRICWGRLHILWAGVRVTHPLCGPQRGELAAATGRRPVGEVRGG